MHSSIWNIMMRWTKFNFQNSNFNYRKELSGSPPGCHTENTETHSLLCNKRRGYINHEKYWHLPGEVKHTTVFLAHGWSRRSFFWPYRQKICSPALMGVRAWRTYLHGVSLYPFLYSAKLNWPFTAWFKYGAGVGKSGMGSMVMTFLCLPSTCNSIICLMNTL